MMADMWYGIGMDTWKRDSALFLGSQTISLFGSMLVQYAISWYITLKTQSGAMMTLSIVCGMIPTFLVSPFAGVWADRFDRKKLIMISDSAIALTTLIVALFFFAGFREYWLLYVALVIRAIGAGVQTPAVGAFLPSLVPNDQLMRVNGYFGSIQSLVMLVAPMASAALLSVASIEYLFFIDVITAAIAVSTLFFFLKMPARDGSGRGADAWLFPRHEGRVCVHRVSPVRSPVFYFSRGFLLPVRARSLSDPAAGHAELWPRCLASHRD